jgi:aquaporin Z
MRDALRRHWPEYLMEAAGLAVFMLSACAFGVLLEHPASAARQALPDGDLRRALGGLAMGLTAVSIFYSPWGKQSGAHINPAVTLTFFRLGKVPAWDAAFYVAAQFAGGVLGVAVASALLGSTLADSAVNYVATVPGPDGAGVAFVAELAISFAIMTVILVVSSHQRLGRYAGVCAATVVALYITFEAPLSGMSMNPARTAGSAVGAGTWTSAWVYFTAPPMGMLLAAEAFRAATGGRAKHCAKLHHDNSRRCIFCGAAARAAAPHALRAARAAGTGGSDVG